jgi:ABC-2 type transport system permease protein
VVHTGEFDRYLLRPVSLFLQLLMRRFNLQQFGDVVIAAAILGFALPRAAIDWTPAKALWLVAAVAAGACWRRGSSSSGGRSVSGGRTQSR